ncbi:adrenodoxin-NADP+ reductase [Nematocida sp. AWRm78]|nr:adrenodoxin-NADP+ reductase [Nematocida sp. AWRm79]KAI5185183.1 adrenodoxin-NADP+ reductase [Nematocida sp. AWRm78]
MHLCIIGAGPAAAYFIRECMARCSKTTFDIFEITRETLGNLRKGVAPDQIHIRKTIPGLERVFTDSRINLIKGADITKIMKVSEIEKKYDAVIIATGAEPRRLSGIPGCEHVLNASDIMRSISANEKILANGKIAVIGNGNVSLDIARVLLHGRSMNHPSLSEVSVDSVDLIGRSSPEHSKFTNPVLSEFLSYPVMVIITEKVKNWIKKTITPESSRTLKRKAFLLLSNQAPAHKSAKFIFNEVPVSIQKYNPNDLIKPSLWTSNNIPQNVHNLTDNAVKYKLTTRDSVSGVEAVRVYDRIISAIGYTRINPDISDMLRDISIPVYRIGWASTDGTGTLADAYTTAINTVSKILPYNTSGIE